jgi:hypothetical protein
MQFSAELSTSSQRYFFARAPGVGAVAGFAVERTAVRAQLGRRNPTASALVGSNQRRAARVALCSHAKHVIYLFMSGGRHLICRSWPQLRHHGEELPANVQMDSA